MPSCFPARSLHSKINGTFLETLGIVLRVRHLITASQQHVFHTCDDTPLYNTPQNQYTLCLMVQHETELNTSLPDLVAQVLLIWRIVLNITYLYYNTFQRLPVQ